MLDFSNVRHFYANQVYLFHALYELSEYKWCALQTWWTRKLSETNREVQSKMAEQRKAVIKNADMSETMQQDAVDIASIALSKFNIEKVSFPIKFLLSGVFLSLFIVIFSNSVFEFPIGCRCVYQERIWQKV